MKRYHVFKDGTEIAEAATKDAALDVIRLYQAKETHQFIKANFTMIYGETEFVSYPK